MNTELLLSKFQKCRDSVYRMKADIEVLEQKLCDLRNADSVIALGDLFTDEDAATRNHDLKKEGLISRIEKLRSTYQKEIKAARNLQQRAGGRHIAGGLKVHVRKTRRSPRTSTCPLALEVDLRLKKFVSFVFIF